MHNPYWVGVILTFALPHCSAQQSNQKRSVALQRQGSPTARNDIEFWGRKLQFFLLYPCTSTLKTSFINQSDAKDKIVYWDTHASSLGTRPQCSWFWLGGTRTQKGCGREITFHLLRHLLNSSRQECEDRAGGLEPLVSQRRLQNVSVLWASAAAAEKWQGLEGAQQPRQVPPRRSALQMLSEEEDCQVGRQISMQVKYLLSSPVWSCSVSKWSIPW